MRKDANVFVRLLVVMLAALTLLLIGRGQVGAQKPVVRFYLFYGETCPHCHEVMDNYLPQVYEKYGDQIIIGVIPDHYPPDATEDQQRAEAAKFVEKFCNPDKPAHLSFYGIPAMTPVYREELYRLSRIKFAG